MVNSSSEYESNQIVVIADSQPLLAQAIAATLNLQGVETVIARSGNRVIEMARLIEPDLIVLDTQMPDRPGIGVCAALKRNSETASIPVIILDSQAELSNRMSGIAAGADVYLTKPVSPIQLIELVKRALAGESLKPGPDWPPPSTTLDDQWLVYARELTELFEHDQTTCQKLEQARHDLEELNQLKTGFLGVITHELLTPFGAIGLTMEVLQRQTKNLPHEYQESLDNLTTEIAGLHQMINGVVKFTELMHKQREPEFGHYDLKTLISYAVQPVAVLAQARTVDFRCLVLQNLPKILVDPELLSEAIFQMAHNAVKFNKPGGRAQIRVYESEKQLVVEVSDTGIGLTPHRLALLGQPFEQRADSLRRGREGLGVGWAFVGYVAQVHYGYTRVKSPGPDQGSTFALILPLITERKDM